MMSGLGLLFKLLSGGEFSKLLLLLLKGIFA